MKVNRVAITGLGAICGLGQNTNEIWNNALEGKSGISLLSPQNSVPVGRVGEEFQLSEDLLTKKEQARFDRFIHFVMHATDEALKQSGGLEHHPKSRMGAILGTGMGGIPSIEKNHTVLMERGARRISPFFIPGMIPNMASGKVTMHYDLHGANFTVASACASAGHALSTAASMIISGAMDLVVSGGCESAMTDFTIGGFNVMRALSKNQDAQSASRPFDTDRDGFVMGEGAGVLILENYDKAKERGANILAELVGFSASSDAYHVSAPHPEGIGAALCMKQALEHAEITPDQIDYINAHGTSTPLGDAIETSAIKKVFGESAYRLNVSSTKSMTGHLLGAASGIESVFCIQSLLSQKIAPTINLDNPDPACDLNYTALRPQERKVEYALNNSFGFGGTNSCLIFKKV